MRDTENELVDDPYDGYASCPDTSRAYHHSSHENQLRWMQKSEQVIQEFMDNLFSFNHFHDAFAHLARQRHEIAFELKQKSEEGQTDNYGSFRKEDDHFRQIISAGDGEQFWKWQKTKIFDLTRELIAPLRMDSANKMDNRNYFENDILICLREKVVVDENDATYYCITIKFPKDDMIPAGIQHAATLTQIELFDFDHHSNRDMIRIEYTPVDRENTQGHLQIADIYYQALLAWRPANGVTRYLELSARLAYLLAHLLLVKQGNSGIVEWMLRGIAFKNGLALGKFNRAEGISWDFKAILTPSQPQYLDWFSTSLFSGWALIDYANPLPRFSYHYHKST